MLGGGSKGGGEGGGGEGGREGGREEGREGEGAPGSGAQHLRLSGLQYNYRCSSHYIEWIPHSQGLLYDILIWIYLKFVLGILQCDIIIMLNCIIE